uniref:Uncharacterized protein n=1 Tax=virus sp. ctrcb4 TaxID=2825824 RepID=A0A8S5RP91_9VIRU|nr:MAG TPA: hypothetical protein [virus sp. ctrcb4]DAR12756.1 MAG TPA: hypothetical protein [Crassvirales sp.]
MIFIENQKQESEHLEKPILLLLSMDMLVIKLLTLMTLNELIM